MNTKDIEKNLKDEVETPKKEERRPLVIRRIRLESSVRAGHGAFDNGAIEDDPHGAWNNGSGN
jgi:hypothetical protein